MEQEYIPPLQRAIQPTESVPIAIVWPHLPVRTRQIFLSIAGIPHDGLTDKAWFDLPRHFRTAIVRELSQLV